LPLILRVLLLRLAVGIVYRSVAAKSGTPWFSIQHPYDAAFTFAADNDAVAFRKRRFAIWAYFACILIHRVVSYFAGNYTHSWISISKSDSRTDRACIYAFFTRICHQTKQNKIQNPEIHKSTPSRALPLPNRIARQLHPLAGQSGRSLL
jgi:hypothetical protein